MVWSRYGRYRVVPDYGNEHLDDATVKTKDANYLFDELTERPISLLILVQVANDTDIVDDATVHWAGGAALDQSRQDRSDSSGLG